MPKICLPALTLCVVLASVALLAPVARAQTAAPTGADPGAGRWQASLDAFAAEDRLRAPRSGGVLFVGSSSIRLWDGLERAFESEPTIVKRGFGGSRLLDCATFLEQLVLPYKPRLIVVYAGDNDLAEGASPQQVLERFRHFVDGVRRELPRTRIAYLSIKPSPARAALLPSMRAANGLIADYVGRGDNLDYIDVFSAMLDAGQQPRRDLFGADALHLNPRGYRLWASLIARHLVPVSGHQTAAR